MVYGMRLGAVLLGLIGSVVAAPVDVELGKRAIDSALLDQLEYFSQYSAAAYCPLNNNSTNTKVTCPEGNCPRVELADTTTLIEFENSLLSDVTGFVATDSTNKLIVIAFRGSRSVRNWLTNFAFIAGATTVCSDCDIATGFWNSWLEAEEKVLTALTTARAQNPTYKIIATGHSLGGALASVAAAALRSQNIPVDLYSYGAPKVGLEGIANFLSQTNLGATFRVTHKGDPVPKLAPSLLGFRHITPEYYITSGNEVKVGTGDVVFIPKGSNIPGNEDDFGVDGDAHRWYFQKASACGKGENEGVEFK